MTATGTTAEISGASGEWDSARARTTEPPATPIRNPATVPLVDGAFIADRRTPGVGPDTP